MRPDPSMRTDRMPRPASWAARIVPDAPPPTIATGTRRSDFIIRPVLRIGRISLAGLDVIVDPRDRLSGSLGEPPRHDCMNQAGGAGTKQRRPDGHGPNPMLRPTHAERTRMVDEEAADRSALALLACVRRRHVPVLIQLATPTGFEPVALRLGI